MLIADGGIGQILERVVGTIDHDFGQGAQHGRRNFFGGRMFLGERDVEDTLGLRIQISREVKAREIEPRQETIAVRRIRLRQL